MSVPVEPPPVDAPLPAIGQIRSYWSPSETSEGNATTHTGAPLPEDLAFVAPPPDEIGEIVTAFSTVRKDKGGNPEWLNRMGWCVFGAFFANMFFFMIGVGLFNLSPSISVLVICAAIGVGLGWALSSPKNSTTYVGKEGAAKFLWAGKDKPVISGETLRFADVSGVYVSQTRHYYNGVYTGTDYAFDFGGHEPGTNKPKKLFAVKGRFYRAKGPSEKDETFHFGTAIETAFSQYRYPQCLGVLAQGGSVPFAVGSQGYLSVSAKGLLLVLRGKEEFVPKENIAGLGIHQGMVTITRAGFKKGFLGVGSDGVYSFPYSQLSSARLFMAVLGYTIRGTQEAGADASPSS